MDNKGTQADFDWLYRRESAGAPEAEPTAVLPTMTSPPATRKPNAYPDPRASVRAEDPGRRRGQQPVPPPPMIPPPPGPPGSPAATPRGPRKHRRIKRIVAVASVLVVAWLAYMIAVPIYAWTMVSTVNATPAKTVPGQPGTVVLLVGSDARDELTAQQRAELGTGSTAGKRTDTMMLLYTPPTGKPALISLPRDSYLPIPGHGRNKLNAAYAFGGAPLLVETVEQNTGIKIDGYLEVGFLAIVDTVNAVGGIDVCLKKPIKDKDSHLDLPAGCQTLDGKNALSYVRMRKSDPTSDLGRMNRQRQVIGIIAKKAVSASILLNPFAYWRLNMAAGATLTTGTNTGLDTVTTAALGFRAISSGGGYTLTVPIANADLKTPAGSSVLWDEDATKKLFALVKKGTTDGMERFVR